MNTAEVVIREMQGDRRFQMCQLLAESIREPRKSSVRHARGEILPFYKTGGDVTLVRIAAEHGGARPDQS